jgi:pimeloyl-ACP methyl ester carboxylesterase
MVNKTAETGDPSVGRPSPETMRLFTRPSPKNREEVMEQAAATFRVIGSPGFPHDEDEARERAGLAYDRAYDLQGIIRQAIAVIASGDRTDRLRSLKVPTLVIHGSDDKMCDLSGGRATAGAIAGSELVVIEGMGHNLPRGLWPRIASLIGRHVRSVETGTPGTYSEFGMSARMFNHE